MTLKVSQNSDCTPVGFILNDCFFKFNNNFSQIINSFSKLSDDEITYFLDTILFKNDIFPVLYPYYSNVLMFLNQLNEFDRCNKYKTSDGLNIHENIKRWLSTLISNFYFKKIIPTLLNISLFFSFFLIRIHRDMLLLFSKLFYIILCIFYLYNRKLNIIFKNIYIKYLIFLL